GTLPLNARYFGVSWYTAFVVGVHAVALVALLGLLVPLLEGDRLIRPGRLRPPAVRLFGLAGVFAGVEVSGSVVFALGWRDPTHLLSCAQSVGRAWVVAGVILALRVRGPWPWSAGHLLTAGALWWVAQFAIVPIAETLDEWLGWEPEAPTWLPPTWWIVWRFGNLLVTLVVLEYLRSSPAAEPAEPAP
ncbi:MAG TPA: hypothetical protein VFS92_11200, partial [Planctomycetota bacterium]|nr:hypothetical protein [Planctomycetota bacterium]